MRIYNNISISIVGELTDQRKSDSISCSQKDPMQIVLPPWKWNSFLQTESKTNAVSAKTWQKCTQNSQRHNFLLGFRYYPETFLTFFHVGLLIYFKTIKSTPLMFLKKEESHIIKRKKLYIRLTTLLRWIAWTDSFNGNILR